MASPSQCRAPAHPQLAALLATPVVHQVLTKSRQPLDVEQIRRRAGLESGTLVHQVVRLLQAAGAICLHPPAESLAELVLERPGRKVRGFRFSLVEDRPVRVMQQQPKTLRRIRERLANRR